MSKAIRTEHGYIVGCFNKERKLPKTYNTWVNVRQRCLDKNYDGYKSVGAKGISFPKRWNKFTNFLEDMGECPEGHTLVRKNNKQNYSKSNCLWVTIQEAKENYYANFNTLRIQKAKKLAKKVKDKNLGRHQIAIRLQADWTDEEIINVPKGGKRIDYKKIVQLEKAKEEIAKLRERGFTRDDIIKYLFPFPVHTGKNDYTLQCIADIFGVSRERIRQLTVK